MCEQTDYADRKSLIHLLNSGEKPWEAAQELGRSPAWAYRWKNRYKQDGLNGLQGTVLPKKYLTNNSQTAREEERVCSMDNI